MPPVRGFFKSLKVLELLIILQIQHIIVYSENSISTQAIKWSLSSPQLKLLLSCSTPKYSYCQGGDLVHANILASFFMFCLLHLPNSLQIFSMRLAELVISFNIIRDRIIHSVYLDTA
jgi:hypothetical protein